VVALGAKKDQTFMKYEVSALSVLTDKKDAIFQIFYQVKGKVRCDFFQMPFFLKLGTV
jgi:hypothetical protein